MLTHPDDPPVRDPHAADVVVRPLTFKDYRDPREQAVIDPLPLVPLPDSLDRALWGDEAEQLRRIDGIEATERLVALFSAASVARWVRQIAAVRGETV
jgi:hypothetical protein